MYHSVLISLRNGFARNMARFIKSDTMNLARWGGHLNKEKSPKISEKHRAWYCENEFAPSNDKSSKPSDK
jgi:hypothetical protein